MSTLTVAIGNSDDKLRQAEWSWYWQQASAIVNRYARHTHGVFLTAPNAPWQSACWIIEGELTEEFRAQLAELARNFRQDSIAVSVGETELVSP